LFLIIFKAENSLRLWSYTFKT